MDARLEYLTVIEIRELKAELSKLREERDALAAHVERLTQAADAVCNRDMESEPVRALDKVLAETPEASLVRLIAEKQKDAIEAFADDWPWGEFRPDAIDVRSYATQVSLITKDTTYEQ